MKLPKLKIKKCPACGKALLKSYDATTQATCKVCGLSMSDSDFYSMLVQCAICTRNNSNNKIVFHKPPMCSELNKQGGEK